MRRHAPLIPFTHDHHHGLAQAPGALAAARSGDDRAISGAARPLVGLSPTSVKKRGSYLSSSVTRRRRRDELG